MCSNETYKQQRFTMFQSIIYEQQIEYNKYIFDYPIKRYNYNNSKNIRTNKALFNKRLNEVNKMISLFKLNCNYMYVLESSIKTYYYVFKCKLTYSIKHLNHHQMKEYKLEIIFLYLYTKKYISPHLLNKLFNHSKQNTYITMKMLREVIRGDIVKVNNAYELEKY
ncbi:MAG: hypothetical protein R3Y05_05940 [bacterium]